MIVSFLAVFFVAGGDSFSMVDLAKGVADRNAAGDLAMSTQVLIFGGMFMGFGIKVPMFPFHTWLPDAHTQAPTQGSVILAAVLLKLGTYGFIRVALVDPSGGGGQVGAATSACWPSSASSTARSAASPRPT